MTPCSDGLHGAKDKVSHHGDNELDANATVPSMGTVSKHVQKIQKSLEMSKVLNSEMLFYGSAGNENSQPNGAKASAKVRNYICLIYGPAEESNSQPNGAEAGARNIYRFEEDHSARHPEKDLLHRRGIVWTNVTRNKKECPCFVAGPLECYTCFQPSDASHQGFCVSGGDQWDRFGTTPAWDRFPFLSEGTTNTR